MSDPIASPQTPLDSPLPNTTVIDVPLPPKPTLHPYFQKLAPFVGVFALVIGLGVTLIAIRQNQNPNISASESQACLTVSTVHQCAENSKCRWRECNGTPSGVCLPKSVAEGRRPETGWCSLIPASSATPTPISTPPPSNTTTDNFDSQSIDTSKWRVVNSSCSPQISQSQGVLNLSMPAGKKDCGAGLELKKNVSGDFAAEVEIPTLTFNPAKGAELRLSFENEGTTLLEVNRYAGTKQLVESNYPLKSPSASFDIGTATNVKIKISRVGRDGYAYYDLGNGYTQLRKVSNMSNKAGELRLFLYRVYTDPQVSATVDNFSLTQ